MLTVRKLLLLVALLAPIAAFAENDSPAQKPAAGCPSAEAHQFDFWIGDWDVTLPDGKVAGHNRIEAILDGCALAEHWQGAKGLRGASYNAYDAPAKMWRQFWVDAQGNVLGLEGRFADGKMILQSTSRGKHIDRISWTPNADGSVRQLWETSEDGGTTWVSAFDGMYRKTR